MTAGSASAPRFGLARLDAGLVRATGWLAMAGICALVAAIAVVVGDIVWRRIGGGSFIGSVDLTQLSVMIAVSWSIPYAFATGAMSASICSASPSGRAQSGRSTWPVASQAR